MRCNICTSSTTACAVWCVAVVGSSALLLSAHAVLEREAVWPADCSGMGYKSLLASAWVREAWSGCARPPPVCRVLCVCVCGVCAVSRMWPTCAVGMAVRLPTVSIRSVVTISASVVGAIARRSPIAIFYEFSTSFIIVHLHAFFSPAAAAGTEHAARVKMRRTATAQHTPIRCSLGPQNRPSRASFL